MFCFVFLNQMSTKPKGVVEKDGYATTTTTNSIKAHWEIETCFSFFFCGFQGENNNKKNKLLYIFLLLLYKIKAHEKWRSVVRV